MLVWLRCSYSHSTFGIYWWKFEISCRVFKTLRERYLGFTIMLLLGEQALNLKCLCALHLWKISPLAFTWKDWPQKKWSLQLKNSSEMFPLRNQRCMTLYWKHIRGILKATYLQGPFYLSHFYTMYVCSQSNKVGACSTSDNAHYNIKLFNLKKHVLIFMLRF